MEVYQITFLNHIYGLNQAIVVAANVADALNRLSMSYSSSTTISVLIKPEDVSIEVLKPNTTHSYILDVR